MTALAYTILAYAIGLSLLWGYALTLQLSPRHTPRDREDQPRSDN